MIIRSNTFRTWVFACTLTWGILLGQLPVAAQNQAGAEIDPAVAELGHIDPALPKFDKMPPM